MAYGWLVARGDMAQELALADLVRRGGIEFGPAENLAPEIAAALTSGVEWWMIDRDRARFAIRRALADLLTQRVPAAVLIAAACAVNERRGKPLTHAEVEHATRHEVARELRTGRALAR